MASRAAEQELQELLAKINAKLDQLSPGQSDALQADEPRICTIAELPPELAVSAARTAIKYDPRNAGSEDLARALEQRDVDEHTSRLAVVVSKYWGKTPKVLTVSFMESTAKDLRDRIISHMNAWSETACISFQYTTGIGNVRISLQGREFKSYVGTDILYRPQNAPTMWLGGFSMRTPESEYKRVVRHEAGHTLGFPHEHMRREIVARLDAQGCYRYYAQFGWNRQMVDSQVLTPINSATLFATTLADEDSIMCYQLPASCTRNRVPILGGDDINKLDYWFAGQIYPKAGGRGAADNLPPTAQGRSDVSEFLSTPLEL
jgi:hypothetical protein